MERAILLLQPEFRAALRGDAEREVELRLQGKAPRRRRDVEARGGVDGNRVERGVRSIDLDIDHGCREQKPCGDDKNYADDTTEAGFAAWTTVVDGGGSHGRSRCCWID